MPKHQVVPVVLLVIFATVLFVAIGVVQMDKNAANHEYIEAEAEIATKRDTVEQKMLGEFDEELFNSRMHIIDEAEDQALARHQAAFDRAYFLNCWICAAGVVMFIVFVAVTIYMGRKAAEDVDA